GDALEEALSAGVTRDELVLYQEALKQGRSLVVAVVDEATQADTARDDMRAAGAESVDAAREDWSVGLKGRSAGRAPERSSERGRPTRDRRVDGIAAPRRQSRRSSRSRSPDSAPGSRCSRSALRWRERRCRRCAPAPHDAPSAALPCPEPACDALAARCVRRYSREVPAGRGGGAGRELGQGGEEDGGGDGGSHGGVKPEARRVRQDLRVPATARDGAGACRRHERALCVWRQAPSAAE